MNTHSTTSNEGWQDIATAPEVVRDLYEALKEARWAIVNMAACLTRLGATGTLADPIPKIDAALRKAEQVQP